VVVWLSLDTAWTRREGPICDGISFSCELMNLGEVTAASASELLDGVARETSARRCSALDVANRLQAGSITRLRGFTCVACDAASAG
jgi:hypothetical protein